MNLRSIVLDDIGAANSIDSAAIDLTEKGIATGVSIFVNGITDVSKFARYKDKIQLGLHLTFSYGRPISKISDLHYVDANGFFKMPSKPIIATNTEIERSVDEYICDLKQGMYSELKKECVAQFQQFISIFESKPAFINVHHDLDRYEFVKDVIHDALPEYKTRAMLLEDKSVSYRYFCQFLQQSERYDEQQRRVVDLIKSGIDYSKHHGLSEVVFHPAKSEAGLMDFSSYNTMRVAEYSILMGEAVQELLSTH